MMIANQIEQDPVEAFRATLMDAGLLPGDVIAIGELKRCPTADKPKSNNGWYVLYLDPPAGAYGNWSTDLSEKWNMGGEPLSSRDRQRLRAEVEQQKAEREKLQAEKYRKKATEARKYLETLETVNGSSPYLSRKGVKPVSWLLSDGDALIVPVLNPEDNKPMSYQRISPDGTKRFMSGGKVAGGFFPIKGHDDGPLIIAEGIGTGLSISMATENTVLCAFNAGNMTAVARMVRSRYPHRKIILAADNDICTTEKIGKNPGIEAATKAARAINGLVAIPARQGDFNDMHTSSGLAEVKKTIDAAVPPAAENMDNNPEPLPLPDTLPEVISFDPDLLPESLSPWAMDIVERMQCPPDFVAVTIMVAMGALIGRRIAIRPQAATDWSVTPNLWAMLVGRPGVLKSPAMEAALTPLKRLAASAVDLYQQELAKYEVAKIADKLRIEAAEKAARATLKKDGGADVSQILTIEKTDPPLMKRYVSNDPTAAALGELLRQNPNGLLVFRDELVSLLKMLDRDENAEARGFYLTGWNGDSPYTVDRITRGQHLHIPAVCISLAGSTQPARIAQYVNSAVNGICDDGLLQRFGLIVWPDTSGPWRDVDRWPDNDAKGKAHLVFERLDRFTPLSIGAKQDRGLDGAPEGIPYLRFDDDGLGLFREWRQDLEARLRCGDLHPAMESHLAKYRKLVPGLALIIHLAEEKSAPVGRSSVLRALAWAEYLETHARRLYASVSAPEAKTARLIIKKIRSGHLSTLLTVREVHQKKWSGLTDRDQVKAGLKLLVDHDWMFKERRNTGGRPVCQFHLNPKVEISK